MKFGFSLGIAKGNVSLILGMDCRAFENLFGHSKSGVLL